MTVVSAVIPTFNRQHLVGQAIRSVLAQSYENFELIVVDDGSPDGTRAAVQAFTDSRLRYIYQDNAGLAAARNTGIRASSGEWVAFLDDDDTWYPDKLLQQLSVAHSLPDVGLVAGGYACVDVHGTVISRISPWLPWPQLDLQTWLVVCPTVPSAVMVRRDWLTRVGGFDETISRARLGGEDWDLWLRLAYYGCPMAWAEEIVCTYMVHSDSMSRNAPRQRAGMLGVLEKFFARPDLPEALLQEKDRVFARAYLRGAARLYGAGLGEEASEDVARAIMLDPGLLADDGKKLIQALDDWVGDPATGDPLRYVEAVFDHLPPAAVHLADRRKPALARALKQALFEAHRRNDPGRVLRHLRTLAVTDLKALGDRGVWSAAAEAVLGRALAARARRLLRRGRSLN